MKKFCLMFFLISLKANAGVFYPIMNMSNVNSEMCVAANIKNYYLKYTFKIISV